MCEEKLLNIFKEIASDGGSVLNLEEKGISKLPAEIGLYKNLKKILLTANNLEYLPVELFDLINLVNLHINENCLKKLPCGIERLTNLEELWLDPEVFNSCKLPRYAPMRK